MIQWITDNWQLISIAITALITFGIGVSDLTKTEEDDKFWGKVKAAWEKAKSFKLEP